MTLTKQPSENLDYDFDFSNAFPAGDNVASATVTATPTGLTLGTKSLSGQLVKQFISSGSTGNSYTVTCIATSAAGRIAELEFTLRVLDT